MHCISALINNFVPTLKIVLTKIDLKIKSENLLNQKKLKTKMSKEIVMGFESHQK